jgi:hypothetical protein
VPLVSIPIVNMSPSIPFHQMPYEEVEFPLTVDEKD